MVSLPPCPSWFKSRNDFGNASPAGGAYGNGRRFPAFCRSPVDGSSEPSPAETSSGGLLEPLLAVFSRFCVVDFFSLRARSGRFHQRSTEATSVADAPTVNPVAFQKPGCEPLHSDPPGARSLRQELAPSLIAVTVIS